MNDIGRMNVFKFRIHRTGANDPFNAHDYVQRIGVLLIKTDTIGVAAPLVFVPGLCMLSVLLIQVSFGVYHHCHTLLVQTTL